MVSTFFLFLLVESTKIFLIYLIVSPRAIWCPCLDRCVSFSLLRLSLEGDCQHQGRTAEASNLVSLSRSWALRSKSHIPGDTKQSLCIESWGQESEVQLLGVGELGICSVAERLPSKHRALEHNSQDQNQNQSSALCSWVL